MSLFEPDEWSLAEKAVDLVTTNPFHPDWLEKERGILGGTAKGARAVIAWHPGVALWGPDADYSDVVDHQIFDLGERLRQRLQDGASASGPELVAYEVLSFYRLYCKYGEEMDRLLDAAARGHGKRTGQCRARHEEESLPDVKNLWEDFRRDHQALFHIKDRDFPMKPSPEHVFAWIFLFRRAFYHIFFNIIGTSKPVTRLRSAVWESIVTHDLLGWQKTLYQGMRDFPTLITGPSGTGKEPVAQAIGRSQYIPFDPVKKGFAIDFRKAFNPVNLSALPPLLIEAELFGHVKGAFAGAVRDRIGRLEECPEQGAVFLDEIGELTAEIQVKLLRVLQTRTFQSVGANEDKTFLGKIIAATNRDLVAEMQAGRFREDFYYRLCADQITTPSLREQLADRPEDLPVMVEFVCRAVVGEEKAVKLAPEVVGWIEQHLPGYTWPGNFRELEQCVRSYTIRKDYRPVRLSPPRADDGSPRPTCNPVAEACETLAEAVLKKKTDYKEIQRRLFTLVCHGTPTIKEAAARLGVRDYRTVQARVTATAPLPADD